jgi:hypothetical protein
MTESRPISILAGAAWFALGVAATSVALAAVDVYLLGHIERVKGANTTFTILVWVALVAALAGALAYAIGAKVWRNALPLRAALPAGVAVQLLVAALLWTAQFLPQPVAYGAVWLTLLDGSFLAPRIARIRG